MREGQLEVSHRTYFWHACKEGLWAQVEKKAKILHFLVYYFA